jgi:orotate phosphoribosyltransferase-like protein
LKKNTNPLAQLLNQHGLTHKQVADLLGTSIATVHHLTAQQSAYIAKLEMQINAVFGEWHRNYPDQELPNLKAAASDLLYKVHAEHRLPVELLGICRIVLRKP